MVQYEKERSMANWVSYRDVKDQVTFTMVFEHYALLDDAEHPKPDELAIRCPFHDSGARTLKANDAKHGFQCFAPDCGKKGNVIDFVSFMEETSFRQAALLLHDWFIKSASAPPPKARAIKPSQTVAETAIPPQSPVTEEAAEVQAVPAEPAPKGRGYMREVEAPLRELIAAGDADALIKWVKEELLASYRRGMEKQKTDSTISRR
jgi:hypothetical protein